MFFCCYCGKSFEGQMNFCPYCGKAQPQVNDTDSYIPYSQPHTPYSFNPESVLSGPAKIFGKLGFILGIAALASGVLMNLLFLIMMIAEFSFSNFSLSYEPFPLMLGVAAVVLSTIARKKGNLLKGPRLGRIFGIIGIILGAISIILFFVFASNSLDFSDLPGFSL